MCESHTLDGPPSPAHDQLLEGSCPNCKRPFDALVEYHPDAWRSHVAALEDPVTIQPSEPRFGHCDCCHCTWRREGMEVWKMEPACHRALMDESGMRKGWEEAARR